MFIVVFIVLFIVVSIIVNAIQQLFMTIIGADAMFFNAKAKFLIILFFAAGFTQTVCDLLNISI